MGGAGQLTLTRIVPSDINMYALGGERFVHILRYWERRMHCLLTFGSFEVVTDGVYEAHKHTNTY